MWTISVPCWGEYHRRKFLHAALPSINAAIEHATGPIRFIVFTDRPQDFANVHFAGDVDLHKFTAHSDNIYTSYGGVDRHALELAEEDSNVALLPCDVIVSKEFFSACEKRFAEGKRAIVAHAARTLVAPENCPVGLSARGLLGWSLSRERRHPVTQGCVFGEGRNLVSWCTYWEGPQGTIARCFHMHPFAVVNDRVLWFDRETVDLDLLDRFTKDEIHVVVSADEMAFAEISGGEKVIPQMARPVSVGSIVSWAQRSTTPLQRHLFSHRIIVQGTGDDHLDEGPANEILRILG